MSTIRLRWRTYLLWAAVGIGLPAIAFVLIAVLPFVVGKVQRDAASRRAFSPLKPLQPIVLDNGFGVYIVDFDVHSKLSDDNVGELLTLNHLPAEYDLTLCIGTATVTDASVSALARLNTIDTLVLDGSGLASDGVARLATENPTLRILTPKGVEVRSRGP